MSEPQKKPGVAFWATMTLVAVLGYPLSAGPFVFLMERGMLPEWAKALGQLFFLPLVWLPAWLRLWLGVYADLWR
jgi:hypothetical protein